MTNTSPTTFSLSEKQLSWLIFVATFLLYAQTIWFGYVLDDAAVLSKNEIVKQGLTGWGEIFTGYFWKGYSTINQGLYRPLSQLMFAAEWTVSPNNPAISHAVNVLIYAVSCVWLFRVLPKLFSSLSLWACLAITLSFAFHPAHTEVVANIKEETSYCVFSFCFARSA